MPAGGAPTARSAPNALARDCHIWGQCSLSFLISNDVQAWEASAILGRHWFLCANENLSGRLQNCLNEQLELN
ncbi:hypothetical protein A3843_06045 [Pseudovibrio exalbescens]|uniref:Uncharacterized protein n=1 Tax=Pseudovibrio exalbescens TaxID=197461 RepID=A0A1U7JJH7_9HYPH|nr:hypothetical protein A3843_06045 [Pseudovibrio exalbescens]